MADTFAMLNGDAIQTALSQHACCWGLRDIHLLFWASKVNSYTVNKGAESADRSYVLAKLVDKVYSGSGHAAHGPEDNLQPLNIISWQLPAAEGNRVVLFAT